MINLSLLHLLKLKLNHMSHLINVVHVVLALTFFADSSGQDKNPPARPMDAKGEIIPELDKAILHVYQARNGDYWFGSKERGVYRYDGKTLVNFTTKDGLSFNHVGGIQEDKAGNIYFTTSSDYDPVRRRFT